MLEAGLVAAGRATLVFAFLTGAALAGGIAMINSVANIGGIFAATSLGTYGLWSMALIHLAGAALLIIVQENSA